MQGPLPLRQQQGGTSPSASSAAHDHGAGQDLLTAPLQSEDRFCPSSKAAVLTNQPSHVPRAGHGLVASEAAPFRTRHAADRTQATTVARPSPRAGRKLPRNPGLAPSSRPDQSCVLEERCPWASSGEERKRQKGGALLCTHHLPGRRRLKPLPQQRAGRLGGRGSRRLS